VRNPFLEVPWLYLSRFPGALCAPTPPTPGHHGEELRWLEFYLAKFCSGPEIQADGMHKTEGKTMAIHKELETLCYVRLVEIESAQIHFETGPIQLVAIHAP
jgi:hypothetical protein